MRLHSWRLRFFSASTMFQPGNEQAEAYLRGVLGQEDVGLLDGEPLDLHTLLSSMGRQSAWRGIVYAQEP